MAWIAHAAPAALGTITRVKFHREPRVRSMENFVSTVQIPRFITERHYPARATMPAAINPADALPPHHNSDRPSAHSAQPGNTTGKILAGLEPFAFR